MKKIGDALKKAVEEKLPESDLEPQKRKRASVILNKNRKDIYQALCLRPCITVSQLCEELALSRPTMNWHLTNLEEAGYIEKRSFFNRTIFCPSGMLSSEESKKALCLLNDLFPNKIYKQILQDPGMSTRALSEALGTQRSLRTVLDKLQVSDLITALRDGRHLRYYPTTKLQGLVKSERQSQKTFRSNLVKRLEKEFMRPEIKEIKGRGLVITIHFGKKEERLEIPYSPIERVLV
ncbi:MAG: helix-turn-helix domain-containing protein [Thermoplasmata archaeon]|nr:helix-turn-helix domain-containing protein [Thermoplasmata archaeon]